MENFERLKPYKSLTRVNEEVDPDSLIAELKKSKTRRYYVEPKIDGMSVVVAVESGVPKIYGPTQDITEKFPLVIEELSKFKGDFRAHGELVRVGPNGEHLPHELIVALTSRKTPHTLPDVRVLLFDFLSRGIEDLREKPLIYRKTQLSNLLLKNFDRAEDNYAIQLLPYDFISVDGDSSEAIERIIKEITTEEGVVLKGYNSPYTREGSKTWWKLKFLCELDLVVTGRQLVKGRTVTWNYFVSALDHDGNLSSVGNTLQSNIDAPDGSILTVSCDRITQLKDGYGIYLGRVKEYRQDKTVPDSFLLIEKRLKGCDRKV